LRSKLRAFRSLAVIPGLCLFLSCTGGAAPPARHVVIISLDTTRADYIGVYGSQIRTPRIDALAGESIVFKASYAAATTTLSSHVSLFTGVWPHSHGVVRNGFTVDERNLMLPEILGAAGFRTAGFSAAVALSELLNFPQGFEVWDQDPERFAGHEVANREARRAEEITDAALAYLRETDDARLFLFVHYVDPHTPYAPPEPYRSIYGSIPDDLTGSLETVRAAQQAHREALIEDTGVGWSREQASAALFRNPPARPLGIDRHLANLYAGEITYMDHHVGRLLDGMRAAGVYHDALIIITSDHGETFWEHGDVWNHGLGVYETTARVPLVIRFPGGVHAGKSFDSLVSNVDIVPTVLEQLGLEIPEDLHGRSLLPLIEGKGHARTDSFSEAPLPSGGIEAGTEHWKNERKAHSIRSGRWKYIRTPYLELEELYDLEADPAEQRDLLRAASSEAARRARELEARLDQWLATADPLPSEYFPRVKQGMDPADTELREQMLENLRALGYVEDAAEADPREDHMIPE